MKAEIRSFYEDFYGMGDAARATLVDPDLTGDLP